MLVCKEISLSYIFIVFYRTDAIPPLILWAQRADRVFVSIQLEDVTDEKITVDTEKLTFR